MLPNVTSYHKPATIGEALWRSRARGERSAFLAGGTALLGRRDTAITSLIDLGGLGLDYIRHGEDERGAPRLEIGAMTTLQHMVESPLLAEFAGGLLANAAHHTATRTIRNTATLGGSIAACGATTDVVVALLALRAEVVTGTGRILKLEDILAGKYPTYWPRLLLEIRVSGDFADHSSAFCRVARLPSDQAIVNVAAVMHVEGETPVSVRLAGGGLAAKPRWLEVAEAVLVGRLLDAARLDYAVELGMELEHPPSDVLGSSNYRRAMLGVLLRRAVEQCVAKEGER
jgi:carbon-monoxide dehydrogenase medium subunit